MGKIISNLINRVFFITLIVFLSSLQFGFSQSSAFAPVAGYGTALSFDGDDDFVQLSSALSIGNTSSTITARVKIPEVGSDGLDQWEEVGVILGNYPDSLNARWSVDSYGRVRLQWNNDEINLTGSTDLRDNTWHHLAFVRELITGQFYVYIDGENEVLTSHASAGSNFTFNTLHRIGADNSSNPNNFHGVIDELQIWNVGLLPNMLNDSLIQQLFYAIPTPYAPGLIGNWHMDSGSGTLLIDGSLGSNNGTLINMEDSTSWVSSLSVSFAESEDTDLIAFLPAYDIDNVLLSFSVESQPSHGTVEMANATTGKIIYSPQQNFNGTVSFNWKVTDGVTDSDIQSTDIHILPINDNPTAGYGTALSFDGDDDFLQLSSLLDIGSSSSTITAWVKIPEVGSGGLQEGEEVGVLLGNYPSSPNSRWSIDNNGKIRLLWNNGQLNLTGSTDLRDNTWHHLFLVRDVDNSKFFVYIDGENETITGHDTAGDNLDFNTSHRIGSDNSPNPNNFHGSIDELQIWNLSMEPTIINNSTIQQNSFFMPSPNSTDLIANWHMDEGRDSILLDGSINGNDAILNNMEDSLAWTNSSIPVSYAMNEDMTLIAYLPGNDVDNDALTFSIESQPDNGVIEMQNEGNGSFIYNSEEDFNGTVSFTWKVSDGTADSDIVSSAISIAAIDDVPFAEDMNLIINENSELADTLSGYDVDGDTLLFTIFTDPTEGLLEVNDSLLGAFTYTPVEDYVGTDEFVYIISDGQSSDTATVYIIVSMVNYPPVAVNTHFTAERNIMFSGMLLGSDPDANVTVGYSIVTQPLYGAVEISNEINNSVQFSGSDNVYCGGSLQYESMTVAFWAEPNHSERSFITRGSSQGSANQRNWDIYSDGDEILFSVSDGTDENVLSAAHPELGEWHYIVATLDAVGDSMQLFINNTKVGSNSSATVDLAYNKSMFIGGSVNHKFIGRMDEVRLFNRSLSRNEIDKLYNGSQISDGLLAYYRMNSSFGDTLYDSAENSINGVANASLWSSQTPVKDFTYIATTNNSSVDSFYYSVSDGDLRDTSVVRITIDLMGNNAPVGGYHTGLQFDGEDDYVDLEDVIDDASYTKIAWIKRTIGHGSNHIISGSGNDHAFWIPVEQEFKLSAAHNGFWSEPHVQDTVPVATNQWYYVAVTFELDSGNMGTMTLYKNGVSIDQTSDVPVQNDSMHSYLGTLPGSDYFHGNIDEVSIWSRALTAVEIKEFMYRTIPEEVQGLVGYWHMDEGSGLVIEDASGNANDGAMYNMDNISSWVMSGIAIHHNTEEDNALIRYLPIYDLDADPLVYSLVTEPDHGVVSFSDSDFGSFVYTPNQDYYGEDMFSWKAFDGVAETEVVSISLSIESIPDPPTATNMLLGLEQNASYTDTLVGFDVDGDNVFFSIVDQAVNGSVLLIDTTLGVFTYNPPQDYIGSDMFTFDVSDSTSKDTAIVYIAIGMDSSITAQFESSHSEVTEGDEVVSLSVVLSGANLFDIYIPYTISSLSSADNESDFIASNGQVSISAGDIRGAIEIQILDDDTYELSEEIIIMLGSSNNAIVSGNTSHFIQLKDDDYPNNWDLNTADYEYYMSVVGKVEGAPVIADNDFLGAFQGGVCRGLVTPVMYNNEYYFPIMVYSNESAEQNISFRYYSADENAFYTLGERINFFSNSQLGTFNDPVLFNISGLENIVSQIVPNEYALHPAYPNPFNPTTTIRYDLPSNEVVTLKIYDMMGREVRTLLSGYQTAGRYSIQWDGRNNYQEQISAGVYLYMIQTSEYIKTRKLILLK